MFDLFGRKNTSKWNDLLRSPMIKNPFPGRPATATPDNPPDKLLGRDHEVSSLKSTIVKVASSDNRPLVIIQGETGMGKSALTSYVFNEIIVGSMDKEGLSVYSVFIEAYGEVKDFRLINFYKQIMKSLDKYNSLNKIVARMVQFFGQIANEADSEYFKSIFGDWDPYEDIKSTIARLNNPSLAEGFVKNLESVASIFYLPIKERWPSYETSLFRTLLYSQAATRNRIEALEALKSGGKFGSFSVSTDGDARHLLNTLMDLLLAINSLTVMVMFIDQLEELFDIQDPKKISMKVFTLLLTLRQIPKFMVVLSGNNQAYSHLIDNLQGDAKEQIEQWHDYLYLPRLNADHVTIIVYELLNKFWRSHDISPPASNNYYPLSPQTIIYLYEKNDRNLRRTLISLHDIFNSFKEKEEVQDLTDPIKSIGALQIIQNPSNLPLQIQKDFAEYLTKSDKIQDGIRSHIPEKGIYNLFKIIYKKDSIISNLGMSVSRPNSGRKPDIYYRLGGNLHHTDSRDIGIEIKCYRRSDKVDKSNVKKTIELLQKDDLHYVIWVSNVELDQKSLNDLSWEIKERLIGVNPKTDEQMAYTYWAYVFEEAMGREPTLDEAKAILERIGIPSVFLGNPGELIDLEIEREYRRKSKSKDTEHVLPKELKDNDSPSSDEIFDDIFEKKINPPIGLDIHNQIRKFILNKIDDLRSKNRKQIRKREMYADFLLNSELEGNPELEVEFIDIMESLARNSDDLRTTKMLLQLL